MDLSLYTFSVVRFFTVLTMIGHAIVLVLILLFLKESGLNSKGPITRWIAHHGL